MKVVKLRSKTAARKCINNAAVALLHLFTTSLYYISLQMHKRRCCRFTTPLYYASFLRLFILRLQRHYHAAAIVSNMRLQLRLASNTRRRLFFVSRIRRLCKTCATKYCNEYCYKVPPPIHRLYSSNNLLQHHLYALTSGTL